MSAGITAPAGPSGNAFLVNRQTGELRTVKVHEIEHHTATDWLIVCREPDDCAPSLTDDEQRERRCKPIDLRLQHMHDAGKPAADCPNIEKHHEQPPNLLPADEWQARTVQCLHEYVTDLLMSTRLRYTLYTLTDRRRKVPTITTIEIADAWSLRPRHQVIVTVPGVVSASARTWLQVQAGVDSGLAVSVPAEPRKPSGPVSSKGSGGGLALYLPADEPCAQDFDRVLAKVRTLIQTNPAAAINLDSWLSKQIPGGA